MAPRGTYHHGALREALIDGGVRKIAEVGAENFSLNELAREIGVSPAAPYRHFEDRDSLIASIADAGYTIFLHGLQDAVRRATNPGDAITQIALAYLAFSVEHVGHFRVMFREEKRPPIDDALASFETLVGAVAAAQESGHLRRGQDPVTAARSIWALVHGAATLNAMGAFSKLSLTTDHASIVADLLKEFLQEPEPVARLGR